jgi:hypothetical protein
MRNVSLSILSSTVLAQPDRNTAQTAHRIALWLEFPQLLVMMASSAFEAYSAGHPTGIFV